MTDRLRLALGPEARNFIESEVRSGGDDEVVVGDRGAVFQFDPVLTGQHAARSLCEVADALALHHVGDIDLDILLLAPADRNPRVGGNEVIAWPLADHRHPVLALSQLWQQFIGHQRSAEACTEYDEFRHDTSSVCLIA